METKILLKLLLLGSVISTSAGIYSAAASDTPRAQETKTPSLQALARAAICREIKKIKKAVRIENSEAAVQDYLANIPDTLREKITEELQDVETLIDMYQGNATQAFHQYLKQLTQNIEESDEAFTARYTKNIEAFIARRANVNSFDFSSDNPYRSRQTPLFFAAKKGYAQMAKELLLYGANGAGLDAPSDLFHTTPLMEAAQSGHINIVELLLQAGANINATVDCGTNAGMTALAFAANTGQIEVVTRLLKAGAQVETDNPFSTTLVHALDFHDNLDIVPILIDAGAHVNARDMSGNTALMHAVQHPLSIQAVALLLQAGADQTITNCMGQTAADIAGQARNQAVLDLLHR